MPPGCAGTAHLANPSTTWTARAGHGHVRRRAMAGLRLALAWPAGSCAPGRVAPDCGTLAGYSARASSACSRTIRTCLGDSFASSRRCQADEHPPGAGCRSPVGPSRAIGPIGSRCLTGKHQGTVGCGDSRKAREPTLTAFAGGQGVSWRLPLSGARSCEVGPGVPRNERPSVRFASLAGSTQGW